MQAAWVVCALSGCERPAATVRRLGGRRGVESKEYDGEWFQRLIVTFGLWTGDCRNGARIAVAFAVPFVRRLVFAVIMAPNIFYAFCWNTENVLRPYMAQALVLTRTQVVAFYTSQALGALLGAIVLSLQADRYGRHSSLRSQLPALTLRPWVSYS